VCGSGVAFVIGWIGMSSETDVSRQMPYLASAGGVGVVLIVVALALIIALRRRAALEGTTLSITGLPQSLHSLAVVYGVENLVA
jgi:hypothetical protein